MEAEAIVFYVPAHMGHIVPTAELAELIRQHLLLRHPHRHLSLIVLYGTDPFEPLTTHSVLSKIIASNPSITFLRLPDRPIDASPTRSRHSVAFDSIRNSTQDVADALRRISAAGTTIRALVLDIFCSTALPVAVQQRIPVYFFLSTGAVNLAGFLHTPAFVRRAGGRAFKDSPGLLVEIPGLPPIPATQMPELLLDPKDPSLEEMVCICQNLPKAEGLLVNTFDDLEPVVMEAIAAGTCLPDGPTPPVYYVGPLIQGSVTAATHLIRDESLEWLDSQPSRSVVFLSFGSMGRFTAAQTKAIAEGLERSRQRFLWVIRNTRDDNSQEIDLGKLLPDGFLERTKGMGIVVKAWAPQVAVLSHDSVGGFVTHCGWNSVLEAVVAGKPMLAWPLYAEQHINRAVLVKTMEMAIPVEQREGDRFVSGEELASRVIELMDSEKGRVMMERSEAMRVKALAARKDGGSSMVALENVVNIWMKE